jgi:hypothetical protein
MMNDEGVSQELILLIHHSSFIIHHSVFLTATPTGLRRPGFYELARRNEPGEPACR